MQSLVARAAFLALLTAVALAGSAGATTLYQEDFEGLALGPYVSSSEGGGDGTDWTATPPAGIVLDTTTTPAQGPPEFFGWTFHDKNSWISTAGDQSRSAFTNGSGTIAVADPDEYDDLVFGIIQPDLFNVFLSIPLDVTGVSNTLEIGFDSSFFPFGDMTGLLDVSFDGGGSFSNLLTLVASPTFPELSQARVNERLTFQTTRTGNDLVVRFGMVNAGNDFWWAIDNISIDTVPEPTLLGLLGLGLGTLARRRRRREL